MSSCDCSKSARHRCCNVPAEGAPRGANLNLSLEYFDGGFENCGVRSLCARDTSTRGSMLAVAVAVQEQSQNRGGAVAVAVAVTVALAAVVVVVAGVGVVVVVAVLVLVLVLVLVW